MFAYNGVSIRKNINHTIKAGIYTDSAQIGESTVTVSGKYYPHLFKEDEFFGNFAVSEMPETEAGSVNAKIIWYEEKVDGQSYQYQLIRYHKYEYGTSRIIETQSATMITINRSMDEFIWVLDSGRIIASSEELYQDYLNEKGGKI